MSTGRHPFLVRMDDWQAKTPGPYKNPEEAARFLASERANHPGEVEDFAMAHLLSFVIECFGHHQRSILAGTRRSALCDTRRKNLSDMSEAVADGRSPFDAMLVIDAEGTKKRIADMDGSEHLFVSRFYSARAKHSTLHAAFHKAIAKRLGSKVTADVFSPSDYEALYRSTVGSQSPRVDDRTV
jgi:hypothetical protein